MAKKNKVALRDLAEEIDVFDDMLSALVEVLEEKEFELRKNGKRK